MMAVVSSTGMWMFATRILDAGKLTVVVITFVLATVFAGIALGLAGEGNSCKSD